MTEYRARFDADVTFTNGGNLSVHDFFVDVADPTADADAVGQLLVGSLGLLMAGSVSVQRLEIVAAPHKGTRGGPSDHRAAATNPRSDERRLVELSHVISAGLTTYPGLPAPEITPFLTRAESRGRYADGTEFALDCITLIGNTGTYIDSPFHRYDATTDLAGLALERLVDLPTVLVRVSDRAERGVDARTLAALDPAAVAGAAVLIHTGDSARFGTPAYAVDAGYLTRDGATWLVDNGAGLVGIDSVNIDDVDDLTRPAHSILLAAGIPIVEHLTGLDQLPPFGARFSAAPPRIAEFGTFPVRAFATVPKATDDV